jgi:hypothetical protein
MGREMGMVTSQRGTWEVRTQVWASGVSPIVPNKANLWRFWSVNEDGRKSKANSAGFGRSREMRSSKCENRDKSEIRGVRMTTNAPNKANCPRFWAGNEGWAEKRSQSGRAGRPRSQISDLKCQIDDGGRGDWDIGFGAVWRGDVWANWEFRPFGA